MCGKTVGKGGLWLLIGFCVAMAVAMRLEAAQPASGDAAFGARVDRFIDEEFQLNPEFATGAGDHRFDKNRLHRIKRCPINLRLASSTKNKYVIVAAIRKMKKPSGNGTNPRAWASGEKGRKPPTETTAMVVAVSGPLGRLLHGTPAVRMTNSTRV